MTDWGVERIITSDLEKATDEALPVHPGLEAVRQELFAKFSPNEFQSRYTKLLATDSQKVARAPEVNNRGAEAYWIRKGATPIAVVIVHFYSWQILAPQVCFLASRRNGENVSLGLARFDGLVKPQSTPRLAAEISSLWVAADHRGQGLGKLVFKRVLAVFDSFLGKGDLGFTAARGKLDTDKGQAIFHYLLDNEERVNGRSPENGQVRITGLTVPIEEIDIALGFNCRYLPIYPDSVPTAILAERAGMRFMGYFKNTSSIYGKVWQ